MLSVISRIVPLTRFKDSMRKLFFTYYNPLDSLSKIIRGVQMLEDGSLLIELYEGIKFYAQRDIVPDTMTDFLVRYRNRKILPSLNGLEYFGSTLRNLQEIYVYDVYQKYYKVKKGDIVVDAGAHIGLFAVKTAKAIGDEGMVIAIEPEANNLKFLEKNIRENELGNVAIVRKGVWNKKDRLKFFIRNETGSHGFLNPDWDSCGSLEVEVDTLDNILTELGVKKVDFIKMDIEGAEIEAYHGMTETLNNNNSRAAIAAYHKVDGKQTYKAIVRLLNTNEYKTHHPIKWGEQKVVYASKTKVYKNA